MVEIYGPRQRETSKRWDYTYSNSTGTYPTGYCTGYRIWSPDDLKFTSIENAAQEAARLNEKYSPFVAKFHDHGHDTADEAFACYQEYQLDHELRFSEKPDETSQHRCAVCNEWTQHAGWFVGSGFKFWHLCQAHQTREAVAGLLSSRK